MGGDLWIQCPTDIWDRIIPQACHSEGFIREAAVAFAALRKALTAKDNFSSQQYCFALQRYGNAVQSMRRALTCRTEDVRKALLGCLLLFRFEAFRMKQANLFGTGKVAVTLYRNGY
jgi:hypothetical protein